MLLFVFDILVNGGGGVLLLVADYMSINVHLRLLKATVELVGAKVGWCVESHVHVKQNHS